MPAQLPVDEPRRFRAPPSRASSTARSSRNPIGTALAAGRFARVPVLNGINHDEELHLRRRLGFPVSGGTNVPIALAGRPPRTTRANIAMALGVSRRSARRRSRPSTRSAPTRARRWPSARSLGDANFACPALQVDRWTVRARRRRSRTSSTTTTRRTSSHRPGFLPPVATHATELQYLFDLPDAPFPATLNADQRRSPPACAGLGNFAASGDPSSRSTDLAVVRRRRARAVARAAATAGRDGLRRGAPLLVLGRLMNARAEPRRWFLPARRLG